MPTRARELFIHVFLSLQPEKHMLLYLTLNKMALWHVKVPVVIMVARFADLHCYTGIKVLNAVSIVMQLQKAHTG